MTEQLDIFGAAPRSVTVAANREEEGFGERDALCGLPLPNYYSKKIFGERLDSYERGYRKGQQRIMAIIHSERP